jgi:hypothetical protein
VERWVYYCVDDFGQWPGLDQVIMRRMEERLIHRVDTLIAVSDTLQTKIGLMGRSSHLLTHGVEISFWQANGHEQPVPKLKGMEHPLILFWGVVDQRLDIGFVRQLAADLEQGTIVFVGPEGNPDPALYRCRRLFRLPPCDFGELPCLARAADVLIMPYADLPVTRAMQPLKLKEYLATGKPVVVRDLPATRPWADCLDVADSPESFSKLVRSRLVTGLPAHQRQPRSRLALETWAEKARVFQHWINLTSRSVPTVAK